MAKPKGKIRQFYKTVKTKDGKKKFQCPHCVWKTTLNATRMKQHLMKDCGKVPVDTISKLRRIYPQHTPINSVFKVNPLNNRRKGRLPSGTDDEDEDNVDIIDEEENRTPNLRQEKLPTKQWNKDNITPEEQGELSSAFSQAVYATATSHRKFEHPLWKKFFQKLRPAFKVPSRDHLGKKFLNKEYEKLALEMEKELASADCLSVGLDGWSNCRRDSIVNILLFTPTPVFLKSVDCGTERHFAAYYAKLAAEVIEEKGKDNFIAFITDNASNMQAAGDIIEGKYSHICWFGCLMHAFNLLISDLNAKISTIAFVFTSCSNISTEIRDKSLVFPIFKEKQSELYGVKKVSLKTIGKTRFGSNIACASAVQKNKNALQSLCVDARIGRKVGNNAAPNINAEVKKQLLADDFWKLLDGVLEFLQLIYALLYKVQTDHGLISKVVIFFKRIQDHACEQYNKSGIFDEDDYDTIKNIIEERKVFAVRDIHFAATLLDPFENSDDSLSLSEKERGLKYIERVATNLNIDPQNVAREFILFSAREGQFSPSHLWIVNDVQPLWWWKAYAKHTALGKVAMRVLSPPVSAAAVERSFSSQALIHSKVRNRLGTEKSGKLTYIYENIRFNDRRNKPEKKKKKAEEECVSTSDSDISNYESSVESDAESIDLVQNIASTSTGLHASTAPLNNVPFMQANENDSDDENFFYDNPIPSYLD